MTVTYTIAEARDQFAAIIHTAEATHEPVRLTRRGKPVAVIISAEAYERLTQVETQPQRDFWTAYQQWRAEWRVDEWDDTEDPFADVRDRTPAPENNPWL